ncbi:MAG: deoxyribose-phosphate aldolase [Microbacteriaceae bacterium]
MTSSSQTLPSYEAIAGIIDHAILKPELTRAEVDEAIALAKKYQLFSLCVRPSDVPYVAESLADSGVKTITVLGFPHGTTNTAGKVAELVQARRDGAVEFDMVINIGWVKSGLYDLVEADMRAVAVAAEGMLTKVILETSYLSDEEIVLACQAAERAGINFVKTSTGFGGGGATIPHLKLMREAVGPQVQVKASGGIRTLESVMEAMAVGVTRLGTSSSAAILDDLSGRLRGEAPKTTDSSGGY